MHQEGRHEYEVAFRSLDHVLQLVAETEASVARDHINHALRLAVVVRPRAHATVHMDVAYPDVLRPDRLAAAALRAQHARRLRRRRVALVRFDDAYFSHHVTP